MYDDLKDLYKKVIPQLAKFEQKMINYDTEYTKITQVIARFDENLLKKANKQSLDDLYIHLEKTFAQKFELDKIKGLYMTKFNE